MARGKNILLISIDDGGAYWRFRDVFRERLQTPNLDRITDVSTTFTSAYCQTPICGPSRNSMMTGLAPHQTGILDNYVNLFSVMRPEQLWQFRLKRAGYFCSTAGKVHHGYAPLAEDVHNVLYSHPRRPVRFGPPKSVPTIRHGGLTGGAGTTDHADDDKYYDHQSASDAVEFLSNYDSDQPFYREVGFHHPHIPFRTPERFKALYDEENFKQPEAWANGSDTANYPDLYMPENIDLRDVGFWRKSVRNYFSAYSHVDSQIGRVWDALQASEHAKNTVVVLVSDHGFHLGDKNRMRKFTLWEDSCRVPLIIHDPYAEPSEVSDPVALLDVGPTILDYADCPPLSGTQGRSLRPQVEGATDPDRAVPTFLFGNASMRVGSYRITRYENGEAEFYDVDDDPWLTRNLADRHPFFETMMNELHKISAAHGLQLGDASATARFGAVSALDHVPSGQGPGTPGHRVHYATLREDGVAALPDGFDKMQYGADGGGALTQFTAVGNKGDNEFVFPGHGNRFQLEIHPGPGRNLVIAQNDDLIVYCDSGGTEVRAGNCAAVLFGGSGEDTMRTGSGPVRIDGGSGPSEIFTGTGPAEITSGTGSNKIVAGTGATQVHLTGGENNVTLESDEANLTIRRTGLPQRIEGFKGGQIDISDWSPIGNAELKQQGDDAILSCVTEMVVFKNADAEHLRPRLVGSECL